MNDSCKWSVLETRVGIACLVVRATWGGAWRVRRTRRKLEIKETQNERVCEEM